MTESDFEAILLQRIEKMRAVLANKAREYASGRDRLHNFKRAGAMQGVTPEKALLGMFAKHMVSIMDMVDDLDRDVHNPIPAWDEKLGDAVNYLVLLEGLVVERKVCK